MENNITRSIVLNDGSKLTTVVDKGLKNSFSTYHVIPGKQPKLVAPGIEEILVPDDAIQPTSGAIALYGGVRCTVFWFHEEWRIIAHKATKSLAEEAEGVIREILEESLDKKKVHHFEYNGDSTACVYKFPSAWITRLGTPPGVPPGAEAVGWWKGGQAFYHRAHNVAKLELATLDNYWYYHYVLRNEEGTLPKRCFNAKQTEKMYETINNLAAIMEVYQKEIDFPGSIETLDKEVSNVRWITDRRNVLEYLLNGSGQIGHHWCGDTPRERIQRLVLDITRFL